MSPKPYATCGCGTDTYSETAAMRHAETCDQMGMPGCRVTVYAPDRRDGGRGSQVPCGGDLVGKFCAHHEADRVRLA